MNIFTVSHVRTRRVPGRHPMPQGVKIIWCDDDCLESFPCQHDVKLERESDGSTYETRLDGDEIALLIKAGKYRNLSADDISHFM